MKIEKTYRLYLFLLIIYTISIFPLTYIFVLFFGIADYHIIVSFGLINAFFSPTIVKSNFFKSLLIGFFISCGGMICSYLFWFLISNFEFSSYLMISPVFINALSQVLLWKLVISILNKYNKNKNWIFFSITTALITIVSFNLLDYWKYEEYYKPNKKVAVQIKLTDSIANKAIAGNPIELRTWRQPLYGIMTLQKEERKTTDLNGLTTFELYKGNKYNGYIEMKNGKAEYFIIQSDNIKENETIEIKTTANNVYN